MHFRIVAESVGRGYERAQDFKWEAQAQARASHTRRKEFTRGQHEKDEAQLAGEHGRVKDEYERDFGRVVVLILVGVFGNERAEKANVNEEIGKEYDVLAAQFEYGQEYGQSAWQKTR